MVGYSQTSNWFLDNAGFETVVNDAVYQLMWQNGAAVHYWADPNDSVWSSNFLDSRCADGGNAPDRVIMDVTEDFYIDDGVSGGIARVAQDIRNVIATLRSKYPSLRQIYLQPVVGGPGGGTCTNGGNRVRASVNHPLIAQAIDQVIAGGTGFDVRRGPNTTVTSCSQYADDIGHLIDSARGPIGRSIGSFYLTR